MKLSLYDVVRLRRAIPEHRLAQGAVGAVVMVFDSPAAYEVEFCDDEGNTLAVLTLRGDEVELVPR